ncbi:hypothetical protein CI109_102632 [Kwoniella shandongensis]|uniref:non-specific serine/threonine protein kinase n=1 Tax=Kwoniella shandongensis TaxID=1734106 RepID=A0A5M6BUB7_9TREE|nr:uncharacterized protein CI109_005213 [Kwoniella shandongensis]KAA5526444.1 hypothetical protein CI109_005213 [Kwoniella shandongensis]
MAATIRPSPVPSPSSSNPPTPPNNYPTFPRLSSPNIHRNASTSSSRSTTTVSSTSSVQAAPMRPPPIETSTAATSRSQIPSRAQSDNEGDNQGPSANTSTPSSRYDGPSLSGPGGRGGWGRNGPRANGSGGSGSGSGSGRMMSPPAIITSSASTPSPILNASYPSLPSTRARPSTASTINSGTSPTTPRAPRSFGSQQDNASSSPLSTPLRVTISMDPADNLSHEHRSSFGASSSLAAISAAGPSSPVRGRPGTLTTPSSPVSSMAPGLHSKPRTLSVDAGPYWNDRRSTSAERERERRQSQVSTHSHSSASQPRKPSIKDFVLGEELGQGSYSTVFAATAASANSTNSPTSPRPPRKYAIKIINQHHLVQEKKVKYAMIERDALVRLSTPRQSTSPTTARGHRRGMSSSSSGGHATTQAAKRKSTASLNSSVGAPTIRKDSGATIIAPDGRDRLSIITTDSTGSSTNGSPLSPVVKTMAGRRPSRTAEPPEVVPEQTETLASDDDNKGAVRSRPPSPVTEEPLDLNDINTPPPTRGGSKMEDYPTPGYSTPDVQGSPRLGNEMKTPKDRERATGQTPKRRRQSLAPSERSVKSGSGKTGQAHPGVIRLHSTFNDSTSLYFVLDLASNGEMTSLIRKYGSFDVDSARYYAAQLIDVIEFMHEKGVIHRDLKPENMLLDDDMRMKITDFGSAKLMNKDEEPHDDRRKRSFVGSADFVSPEVLRNEPASTASDIWAFGCILYQFLAGKPPFRGATDYLTFQKILKNEMEFPDGFDEDAKALVNLVLNLDPNLRPSIPDIKSHPFFALTDFLTIWTAPAPTIKTGLREPVATLASLDPASDVWAVFDDEVSDGGFEYDQDEEPDSADERERAKEPRFDRHAAAHAVHQVDNPDSSVTYTPDAGPHIDLSEVLDPPRPAYAQQAEQDRRKSRGWSHGSSSSGGNRSALTGWLETMRIGGNGGTNGGHNGSGHGIRSNRTSRTSVRSEEMRTMMSSQSSTGLGRISMDQRPNGLANGSSQDNNDKWSSLLLANERIIFTSPILAKTSSPSIHLPSFLLPAPKRRQLILTDFPRLIVVKDDTNPSHGPSEEDGGGLRIKGECVLVVRPSGATGVSTGSVGGNGVTNRVLDVQEKGGKGFVVQTPGTTYWYTAESTELRDRWMSAVKKIV